MTAARHYPEVTCFWLERTDQVRRRLRRYHSSSDETHKCPGGHGYHDASVPFDVISASELPNYMLDGKPGKGDPRWATKCQHCDYAFTHEDAFQLFTEHLYRRADTGALTTLRDAPAGAIWNAEWLAGQPQSTGPDGRSLQVKLPNGRHWSIDSIASNCDQKDRPHKCWVRHGEPPVITVDKRGDTCNAGAGSIWAGDYHGFLINGVLRSC